MLSDFRREILYAPVLLLLVALAVGQADPQHRTETPIAPDMSIVTEISNRTPFAGQQFSIIYRLLAEFPPAAIDIDTQQFPGFWAETLSISEQPGQVTRLWKGRTVHDFLLRQVVAFPLAAGERQIPSLSLKIKRAIRTDTRALDDWDLRAKSEPLTIAAKPLPGSGPDPTSFPLVGEITVRMKTPPDDSPAATFELEGSANLALFDPQRWLRTDPGVIVSVNLLSSERLPQTIDAAGQRRLSVKYRQQWRISLRPLGTDRLLLHDVELPYFHPDEEAWHTAKAEGMVLAEGPANPGAAPAGSAAAGELRGRGIRDAFFEGSIQIWGGILVLLSVGLLVVWRKVRKRTGRTEQPEKMLKALEKKRHMSPRAFLDGSGRLLLDCARRQHRSHDLGKRDETLDQCWRLVEKCRFNTETASGEALDRILLYLNQLVQYDERSG